ncbi:MAG: lipase family protein [Aureliella sp.]
MSSDSVKSTIKLLSERLQDPVDGLSMLRQSLLFAELAAASYYDPQVIEQAIRDIGFDDYEFFDRDGAQAYLFWTKHDCVVVCRGTEPNEWNDIKADVNAVAVLADTAGRVHRGFKREVDDLWPRLEQALKENDKPLWFAGHSLGGAMATICAGRCKLAEIPSNPNAIFTYGSPRVGNERYINFVKVPHYRWVNNNDIVTRVPPAWLGYRHNGKEFYLDSRGELKKYTAVRRVRDRWNGFFTSLRKWQFDHLADHSMEQYIEYIQRAAQKEEAGEIPQVVKLED